MLHIYAKLVTSCNWYKYDNILRPYFLENTFLLIQEERIQPFQRNLAQTSSAFTIFLGCFVGMSSEGDHISVCKFLQVIDNEMLKLL